MIPLFPSLNPTLIGSLMNGTVTTTNEEAEIVALEQEQQTYMNLVENIAQDIQPIGKMQSEQTNNDESDNGSDASGGNSSESDAEAASDDSDAEEIA